MNFTTECTGQKKEKSELEDRIIEIAQSDDREKTD